MINRGFANLLSNDLPKTRQWYVELLGWEVEFGSDWFVHLRSPAAPKVELGIMAADHELVPESITLGAGGTLLTFVVDDVDDVHLQATNLGYTVVEPPTDMFYGQRRMILRDVDGNHVDISSLSTQRPTTNGANSV